MNLRTLSLRISAMLLAWVITTVAIFSVACGPPSKKTITKLHNGAVAVVNVLDANISLPDELLQEKIINTDQYQKVKEYISAARIGAGKVESGLATALTVEKPSLQALAPIVADIIVQLRGLNQFVNNERVQKLFGAAEIGLRVLGSYFALQISQARDAGYSDQQICEAVGLKYERVKFTVLATAYDGRRFDEYAAAL